MNYNHSLIACLLSFLFIACDEKKEVDLLVLNAKVYTVDDDFSIRKAFVVNKGKILEVGAPGKLTLTYKPKETFDAENQIIFPGFIDAHAHFYGLGLQYRGVDLKETQSFEEVVARIVDFQKNHNADFITGMGWDQNDWQSKTFPTHDTLTQLFPDTPIAISRIDGHAMLVNQKALDIAGITAKTQVKGGEIQLIGGKPTGILIDNAISLVRKQFPKPSRDEQIHALLAADAQCLAKGLTTVDDAGLPRGVIQLIDSLQQAGKLKSRIYAMIENSPEAVDYYLKNGAYQTDRLNVRSFKVYADGALGSRGAALQEAYSDLPNHHGKLLLAEADFKSLAAKISQSDFQLNTHAIGDAATELVLQTYDSVLKGQENRRWRVEHAQIIQPEDMAYFNTDNILPSVQPTHATSDMYWVEKRLGKKRLKWAYAYKRLLKSAGKLPLGTDFPVEKVNPLLTFYAAISRKDLHGKPEGGFYPEQALSRKEALKGMTIWAAYANFEEQQKGSLEAGKWADFVVLDEDIMTIPVDEIPEVKVMATFIAGKKVYHASGKTAD